MKIENIDQLKKLQNRLNRIQGQVAGISAMLEDGRDCREVLQQIRAAQAAMQSVTAQLLEQMVVDCLPFSDQDVNGKKVIGELIEMIKKQ